MNIKRLVAGFFLLIFISFLSCKKPEKSLDLYSIKLGESLSIPLDNETSPGKNDLFFYENKSDSYLVLLNKLNNKIQFYDWRTKQLSRKIPLQTEGPNGVGSPLFVQVVNLDSIYVLSSYHYRLSVVDSNGNVKNKFRLIGGGLPFDDKNPVPPAPHLGYIATPLAGFHKSGNMIIKEDNIYMNGMPYLSRFEESFFLNGKLGIKLSTIDSTVSYYLSYSKEYLKGNHYPSQCDEISWTYNDAIDKVIVNFPIDNNIYEINLDGGNSIEHWAGSKYFDKVEPMTSMSRSPDDNFNHYLNNNRFTGIYYDKYRNLYYRKVEHKINYDGGNFIDQYVISLIILNDKFQKIGEVELPKIYWNGIAFINREGIYLYHPADSEDKMVFTFLELIKN